MAYHYIIPEEGFDHESEWKRIEEILPENIIVWYETSQANPSDTHTKVYCLKGENGVAISTLSKNGPVDFSPINYLGATVISKEEEKITDVYNIPFKVSGCGQIYVNMFNYDIFKGLNEEFKKLVRRI